MITMSDINKSIQKYINNVSKSLICNRKLKKTIINDFRNSILDYKEENIITDIKKIYEHFGTPNEIVQIYMSDPDIQTIKRHINIKRIILAVLICILAFLAFFLTELTIINYYDGYAYSVSQIIIGIEYSTEDFSVN